MNPLRRIIRNARLTRWQRTILALVIAVSFGCGVALAFIEHAAGKRSVGFVMVAPPIATCSQFEGYKPGQNRCRIELANDTFEIAKTSRMHFAFEHRI